MSFEVTVRAHPHKNGYHCGRCRLSSKIDSVEHCNAFGTQIDVEEVERDVYARVRCEACVRTERGESND